MRPGGVSLEIDMTREETIPPASSAPEAIPGPDTTPEAWRHGKRRL